MSEETLIKRLQLDLAQTQDRVTNLEELSLIMRAKVEPETLARSAIDRAKALMDERAEASETTRSCVRSC